VLFLRKQLTMLLDRGNRPRRARWLDHFRLVLLSKCFAWRDALFIFKPATLVRWQRGLARRLWRWKSRRSGRPPLAAGLQGLIARMARENPSWGCRRIASELRLKLGLLVSARTVHKYLTRGAHPRKPRDDQRWSTFVRNHAHAIVACDFVVSTTVSLRTIYNGAKVAAPLPESERLLRAADRLATPRMPGLDHPSRRVAHPLGHA
jgi:hypothetical protein